MQPAVSMLVVGKVVYDSKRKFCDQGFHGSWTDVQFRESPKDLHIVKMKKEIVP